MNSNLAARIRGVSSSQGLVVPGDRVLVAVSGGPDSVALLHLFLELRDEFQLHLEVAHLQHGIRGEEAREDARFVAVLTDKLGLPFHLKEVSVPEIRTAAGKGNLEALARQERYRFFLEVAQSRGVHKVATAHTLDDQAETVMMWFLRGAGMTGLGGIAPRLDVSPADGAAKVTIIRPLLDVSKAEILEYLNEYKISHRIDRSNLDPAYMRNWLRLELLPKIRERIDGRLALRLGQQAELVRDEDSFLDRLAGEKLATLRDGAAIRRDLLAREPLALQRRVLRRWIAEARGTLKGLNFAHLAAILRLSHSGAPHDRFAIPGGWEFVCEYEKLILKKTARGLARTCYNYHLSVGKTLRVDEAGVEIHSEKLAAGSQARPNSLTEAVFDAAFLTGLLTVRNFRSGDRYQPLGMSGHKKVQDLFIDEKIPLRIRAVLPLLTMAGEILWIPGHGRSELGKISPDTHTLVRFKSVSAAV